MHCLCALFQNTNHYSLVIYCNFFDAVLRRPKNKQNDTNRKENVTNDSKNVLYYTLSYLYTNKLTEQNKCQLTKGQTVYTLY